MSEKISTVGGDLEAIVRRLQEGREALMASVQAAAPEQFERKGPNGDTIKRVLERAVNDLNFYYGQLVARAVSLPQPPYMEAADFSSLGEAKMSLQLAHRRFANLLHDLKDEDLERTTSLENTSEHTLRQVLETAAAHDRLRARQIEAARGGPAKGRRDGPRNRR